MNQIDQNYNDSKVKPSEKLVGQINPDNFNFESNFSPIVKTEVKQEIAEEPLKDVEKNANIKNEIAKSQSKCTNSESSNEPIRLGPQRYGCLFCPKLMHGAGVMNLHIRTHTGEKPFECSHCGKRFNSKGNLVKHSLIHTGEKPIECETCGKTFRQKITFNQHRLTHAGEQPFECRDCGKKFTKKANLERHRLIHSGEQPFECND